MQATFGLIVGNRGFFPDELAQQGRVDAIAALEKAGHKVVCLTPEDTKFGAVETREEAVKCARLFQAHQDQIDGIVVTLPNFGDEKGVAESLRLSKLDLPVLIHAASDDPAQARMGQRRDSFCGKISVCNNLRQYGIPFTLTEQHTNDVADDDFAYDLDRFAAVCKVVKGLSGARIGAVGARPAAFNTVRYSEKILEGYGIAVETVDLSEIFGRAGQLTDSESDVKEKMAALNGYCQIKNIGDEYLLRMAKLGVILDRFVAENALNALAIQCWTAMEQFYGVVPCTMMSMLSNALVPSACEVDVAGALGMYALQLASGRPSAILDWNNNYGGDPDKCVLFHCSNIAKDFLQSACMDYQEIIASSVGQENTYGTIVGRIKSGPATFCRFATDDDCGLIRTYVGEGTFTDDTLETFGGYGVLEVAGLQDLLQYICLNGFEHHVAVNHSEVADVLDEAFVTYLGYENYYH